MKKLNQFITLLSLTFATSIFANPIEGVYNKTYEITYQTGHLVKIPSNVIWELTLKADNTGTLKATAETAQCVISFNYSLTANPKRPKELVLTKTNGLRTENSSYICYSLRDFYENETLTSPLRINTATEFYELPIRENRINGSIWKKIN